MTRGRIWHTWDTHFVWRFLNNLCVAQQPRTITLQRRSPEMSFSRIGLVICALSLAFCLSSSPGEAASCPCFQWDTRTSSLREATCHRPAAVQPEIWSKKTSQYTNWDKLSLDSVQAEFYCSSENTREIEEVHQETSSACPLSREKDRLKYLYLFVSLHNRLQ